MRTYGHRVSAVKSGRKTGKSDGLAIRGIHWMIVRARPTVCMTAPTFPQVEKVLWQAIVRLYHSSKYPLGGKLYETPSKGWVTSRGTLYGRTSDRAENLQGSSGADQLILVDEASGYKDELLNALLGNLAGGGEIVLAFNPTQPSGLTYDAFHSRAEMFHRVDLSSLDTPNLTGSARVPGLMDADSLDILRGIWGEGTPAWHCHVEGKYPGQGVNTIVGLADIERAKIARCSVAPSGQITVGIDVARFGDDRSVVVFRRGQVIVGVLVARGIDGVELAGVVVEALDHLRDPRETAHVNVDASGNASCADQLHALAASRNMKVTDILGGSKPTKVPSAGPGYHDLNAQMWFGARDWFREGGSFPSDEDIRSWQSLSSYAATERDIAMLEGELTGRTFDFDANARHQIEPKKSFKERLRRSPDMADAFVYSLLERPTIAPESPRAVKRVRMGRGGF